MEGKSADDTIIAPEETYYNIEVGMAGDARKLSHGFERGDTTQYVTNDDAVSA